jgi:8-oxo-dGTP pyrophosphatase MutT (NUDIX family)
MLKEKSFGVIPICGSSEERKLLLIRHRAGHWGFPKGHSMQGEDGRTTASRELKEETGLEVTIFLDQPPYIESYSFIKNKQKIDKIVTYYVAIVEGTLLPDNEEVIDALWCSPEQAYTLITYNKEILYEAGFLE